MDITLDTEDKYIKHSFFCTLESGTKEVTITNAGDSPYKKGWVEYAPFESVDGQIWSRVKPGTYNGKSFSFSVSTKAKYAALFPYYSLERMKKYCASFKKIGNDAFFLGDKTKPTLVLLAGQHPAETMGLYFLEGILKAISSDKKFLNRFSVLVFPFVNKKGIQQKNHRLTLSGIDLNREWACASNPILAPIKEQIGQLKNIYAVIDIHGDEVSKKDYVIYNKSFNGSGLAKNCQNQGFLLLKKQSCIKQMIKTFIHQGKLVYPKGQTARDYFEKRRILSITIELSAFANTPETCIQKGMHFFQI